jgi:hypothetical protein
MPRSPTCLTVVIALLATAPIPAVASPACLKEKSPFALAGDTMRWTMNLPPGMECIQGLRWSYMQIYNVEVSESPKNGKLVIVGSGFRYYASSEARGADHFTLLVSGKNRRDVGKSVIEITVEPSETRPETPKVVATSDPDK